MQYDGICRQSAPRDAWGASSSPATAPRHPRYLEPALKSTIVCLQLRRNSTNNR
jgi:hypothetical protein